MNVQIEVLMQGIVRKLRLKLGRRWSEMNENEDKHTTRYGRRRQINSN